MSPETGKIKVNLNQAILMIARALDYVGADDFNHGHRVGYIAHACANAMGWSTSRQEFIFFAGLLHDCGVSSSSEHKGLINTFEPKGAEVHAIRGADYLKQCQVLHPYIEAVRHHHTHWNILEKETLSHANKEHAALLFLSDRIDALRVRFIGENHPDTIILFQDKIAATLKQASGKLFHPDHVDTMCQLMARDGFWFKMESLYVEEMGSTMGDDGSYSVELTIDQTTDLATFMSRIVDAKSSFTCEHSRKVAMIAKQLAAEFEFDELTQSQIHVAGLLHDLGKLKVPDQILHKPDELNSEEFSIVKRHVFDTGEVLHACFQNSQISKWAANHHETLDGNGYPYRLKANELDLPSRIIAIADIFQALSQDRPYREKYDSDVIVTMMQANVDENKIDGAVFDKIKNNIDYYYELSTRQMDKLHFEKKAAG